MNKKTFIRFNPYILSLVFYSSTTVAFSPSPENSENYSPAAWQDSVSAEEDAENAIKHNDLRLLGFAGKNHSIPGVESIQAQDASEKCGVRYFDEFSDVIRDRDQLEQMKKAKQYAAEYNKVILTSCTLGN
jgi:hypothetical protein